MPLEMQDPDEALTWSMDWTDWLDSSASPSDTLSSSSWSITPSTGVTLTDRSFNATSDIASVRVSGLTRGTQYVLTNKVVSGDGDTGERSIVIWCEKR